MAKLGPLPRYGIIGGSGVQVSGREPWTVETPFGKCLLSTLDDDNRIIFASRHHCTDIDPTTGKANYAPPHEVNYRALIWALVAESGCKAIVALSSTGTLHPDRIPVGSVVIADDYYMVKPEPMTFWGSSGVGMFDVPENGIGRMHYTPADPLDRRWAAFREHVQTSLRPVLPRTSGKVRMAQGQPTELWPAVHSLTPGTDLHTSTVYVNTIGPRFETRAEIRAYQSIGHVVGMTCGREWALCEELCVPYCLLCFCDNACNGLSSHPGGALQEYLEHKQAISDVTGAVVQSLVSELTKFLEPQLDRP